MTETQEGSFLGGSFILSHGTDTSAPIAYDVTTSDLRDIILSTFSDIKDVQVVYEVEVGVGLGSTTIRRFLITVVSPVGDLSLMTANGLALIGSNAAIRTYEVVRGVGSVTGTFSLQSIDKESTILLSDRSSDSDMQKALMQLSSIGDIIVSKSSTNANIISSVQSQKWQVTFTTLGIPINAEPVSLLSPVLPLPADNSFDVTVKRIQAGCCGVSLTLNGQEYTQPIGVAVDEVYFLISIIF